MFSPDGRWLAYQSDESGRPEIYVTAFPRARPASGRSPPVAVCGRAGADGPEILYHATDGTLMAVPVESRAGGLVVGSAVALFNTGLQPSGSPTWALSADGERVLVIETITEMDTPNLTVVVNWLDAVGGS